MFIDYVQLDLVKCYYNPYIVKEEVNLHKQSILEISDFKSPNNLIINSMLN
jgi:hypothetical protein